MKRSNAREIAIQLVFNADENMEAVAQNAEHFFEEDYYASLAEVDELYAEYPDDRQMLYIKKLVTLVAAHLEEIDAYIERYSHGWSVKRISKTALAVLRCAICEILYFEDVPDSAAINDAVELAKGYDTPETVSFINGVLGAFYQAEVAENKQA